MFRCFLKPFEICARRAINFHKFPTWICFADHKLNLINSNVKVHRLLVERSCTAFYINHQTIARRVKLVKILRKANDETDLRRFGIKILNLFTRLLPHKIWSRLHQSSVIKLADFSHVRWFKYCCYVMFVELCLNALNVEVLVFQLH